MKNPSNDDRIDAVDGKGKKGNIRDKKLRDVRAFSFSGNISGATTDDDPPSYTDDELEEMERLRQSNDELRSEQAELLRERESLQSECMAELYSLVQRQLGLGLEVQNMLPFLLGTSAPSLETTTEMTTSKAKCDSNKPSIAPVVSDKSRSSDETSSTISLSSTSTDIRKNAPKTKKTY